MKKELMTFLALATLTVNAQAQLPALKKIGTSTCLMVDGKPFVMRSGELHNSTASSISYMQQEKVFDRLKAMNLNSVIATVSWELMEPVEGKYDFSHVDYLLKEARAHDMKLSLIWFGSFKNPFMTYAPLWVKGNAKKFPHAVDEQGKDMEMLCLQNETLQKAEIRAYTALMKYLKDNDKQHTVVMMQVENEPGLRGSTRDFSAQAEKAWKSNVPSQLIDYLKKNDATLMPDLKKAWNSNGNKTKGDWETVFGKSLTADDGSNPILNLTEHLFTACTYASYLDALSEAGKKVYALPTFINASVFGTNSRGRSLGNGCSIGDFFDVYRACAPSIDILTPNSYMQQLDQICEQYSWKGNPIFIPESSVQGARGLYAVGEWDAICFSPFGIDSADKGRNEAAGQRLKECYALMAEMEPLILSNLGSDKMRGVYIYNGHDAMDIEMGDYKISFIPQKGFDIGALMAGANNGANLNGAPAPEKKVEGGAIIIQTAADEFIFAGYGINATIALKDGVKHKFCGYDAIYEGQFKNGTFVPGRLLNGDERNVTITEDEVKALKVKLFHY